MSDSSSSWSPRERSPGEEIIEQVYALTNTLISAVTRPSQGNTDEASSSAPRKRKRVNRDRDEAHERLEKAYFVEDSIYDEDAFRRRFRMSKRLFQRLVNDLSNASPYFQQRNDARNVKGFSSIQKCTSAIRQLAYGTAPDSLDEYLHISERTSREVLQKFCKLVVKLYSREYLRRPTSSDIEKLYELHESRHGFPGMLGSIDCTHWEWKNCPVAWRGQYTRGDHGHPTIMLEAVASHDLWFWHAFFGVAGSNNDINVLNQSPLFDDVYCGKAPVRPFVANGVQYTYGYYLADGIYPDWATFVKSFQCPQGAKRTKFKTVQESARKDVERAFGVLKSRWAILQNPARPWSVRKLCNIMYACVILHNMILQDEGKAFCTFHENELPEPTTQRDSTDIMLAIRSQRTHLELRSDLVDHIDTVRTDVEIDA